MDEILGALGGLVLMGVPLVAAIPFIIAGFRKMGLSERWSGPVAVVLGISGIAAIEGMKAYPFIEPWVAIVFLGLLIGLASNGAYSQINMLVTKATGKSISERIDPTERTE